jgi:hypothetical protein
MGNDSAVNQRGEDRERLVDAELYVSGSYLSREQVFTYAQQIADLIGYSEKSIVEIGVGAGVTSASLRALGFEVLTCDINANLKPDVVCSIDNIAKFVASTRYGLVSCCEVLEHLPFSRFESCISTLASISRSLYLTLPVSHYYFGFGGLVRLPKICFPLSAYVKFPVRRKLITEHYWEIGDSRQTSTQSLVATLRKYYGSVYSHHSGINPYHKVFKCVDSKSLSHQEVRPCR